MGVLEPRKQADLIVIDGDPLKDIGVLQKTDKIAAVFTEGIDRTSS